MYTHHSDNTSEVCSNICQTNKEPSKNVIITWNLSLEQHTVKLRTLWQHFYNLHIIRIRHTLTRIERVRHYSLVNHHISYIWEHLDSLHLTSTTWEAILPNTETMTQLAFYEEEALTMFFLEMLVISLEPTFSSQKPIFIDFWHTVA